MIGLLVLDLDGTIIGSDGQVDDCVWEGIEELHKAGVRVCACTGRPGLGTALRIAERIGPRHGHVFQNGAVVAEPNGDTLNAAALKEQDILHLVARARELNYALELYTPTNVYIERRTPALEEHAKLIGINALVRDLNEVARSEPVVRAQWVVEAGQREQAEAISIDGTEITSGTAPALPGKAFVSVTRAGVDKGSGLRSVVKSLGVELENVMAIGDSSGDVPMLEIVGHPRVMPNGEPQLQEVYPTLRKSVDQCGVLEAFEQILRGRNVRSSDGTG